MPVIRKAVPRDCSRMAPQLREADRQEIAASTGREPFAALWEAYKASSHCFTIEHDGEPIAIFGGAPIGDGSGCPWMLGTDGIEKHWVWFLRNSPDIVDRVQRHYPRLCNMADVRNVVHLKWLRWCGFRFGAVTALGPEDRPFQYFERDREECASP